MEGCKRFLRRWWLCLVFAILVAALMLLALCGEGGYIWLYVGFLLVFVFAFRPHSPFHTATVDKLTWLRGILAVLTATATVVACVGPMGRLSVWNGENPEHRNQYELMAEALLDGRIHLEYGDEEALAQLDNPYDPEERKAAGVSYQWDHAFYNGRYYMYFGIVPVLLVFLPYRVVTGTALTTYHATQLFVGLTVVGIFALLYLLARLFFRKLPFSVYLLLAVAFSVMSVWYSTAEPALYCTAITAALALEVWSLFFFVWAVWGEKRENRQLLLAAVGALLGALAFGCRPTVALANGLVVPMLVVFIRQRRFTGRLLGKLLLAALPYGLVAAGLMGYNYARFGNVLEFGQAYQLTVADQTAYGFSLNPATLVRIYNGVVNSFFQVGQMETAFPYLRETSAVGNFPLLLLWVGLVKRSVRRFLQERRLWGLTVGLLLVTVLITAVSVVWTPYLLERYRMDVYFLLGIGCFIVVGAWYTVTTEAGRARLRFIISLLGLATVVTAFLLYARTISAMYEDVVHELALALGLG